MPKQVKIDFYRVEMPGGAAVRFETIISEVATSANDETRNLEFRDHVYRLQECGQWNHCYEGDMIRIRMDTLPPKADLEGHVEPLEFEDDEGLGEQNAFLYDPRTRVLVLQRNRFGVSAGALAYYFQQKANLDSMINLHSIFLQDALVKLAQMEVIRKFQIKLAGPENHRLFRNLGIGVREMVRLTREFQAPKISVTLSMGHGQGSLALPTVLAAARGLAGLAEREPDRVEKIEVAGTADDERVLIDLLEYRMIEEADIVPNTERILAYEARRQAVRTAFANQREELRNLFTPE